MKIKLAIAFSVACACLGSISTANAASVCRAPNIVCSGQTTPGDTDWQVYGNDGIYLDVDTSECALNSTPAYITSMSGTSNHWATSGSTSVYNPTSTGFRIYVRFTDGRGLTPAFANGREWAINWMALSSADCQQ